MEFTLFSLGKELVVEEAQQNLVDMLDMSLLVRGENEDIIQMDEYEPIEHISENVGCCSGWQRCGWTWAAPGWIWGRLAADSCPRRLVCCLPSPPLAIAVVEKGWC